MATAIKHQQQIHKDFADHLDEDKRKRAEEILAENPDLNLTYSRPKTISVIATTPYQICKYYFTEDDAKDVFDFDNQGERTKSVAQVVRANVRAYDNIVSSIEEEGDEDYLKIYKRLRGDYESYFSLAAEDCLEDVYGREYVDFRDEQTAKWDAVDKSRSEKRKA